MRGGRADSKKSNYASFKSEMKSTIDAAALQNNIAQKYNLPGSKLAVQVSILIFLLNIIPLLTHSL
jgi:hypothetical protein